ncbi:uncharacterized protein F4812DRAFT_434108 [Daldinia caldariorum]|uniref:uncharacterized protein n=1 Tax=Daldinia caldariorum TaxID=326644 RepID=UPI0020089B92|nr:uncharacterized protein F4812DRAFT_434108 [Daldinia caldariorum]KAI1466455.1 hypothetical protein F4812DRAFT_434108 [Daldinia caldariorum]
MDDPWGSPWALPENTSKNDPPIPSPPKSLLSPPPRAFFGSASNFQSQSPWATEYAHGEWTSTEQADVAANVVDWGVWAEPSPLISQTSPKPDDFGKRSSVALPSSAATSPGLRPLPRSRTSSVYRHHSPDPWAAEVSLQDRKGDSSTPVNALGINNINLQEELVEAPVSVVKTQDDATDSQAAREDQDDIRTEKSEQILATESQVWELPSPSPSPSPSPRTQKRQDSGFSSTPKVDTQDTLSRPPSTLSLSSSRGVDHQDSPITSIDEDTKSCLPKTSRKDSGKVQELVGMYDGLTKIPREDPFRSTRLELPKTENRGRSPSQARRSSSPAPRSGDTSIEGHIQKSSEHEVALAATTSAPVQQIIDKYGPIQFDIDFQLVDKVFPDIAQDLKEDDNTRDNSGVPDQIIKDSFTAISERKTWYRLSRYGSMRKHDLGDDDNYHRVEWSTSRVHNDVIKIIRRWMEEDSISGRVTPGAGIRTSVFNWDSSAAPVDLGKVFARKTSITHSRKTSLPSTKHSLEKPAPPTSPIKSPIKPPDAVPDTPRPASIPSFNWSSDAKSSPTTQSISSSSDGVDRATNMRRPGVKTVTIETISHTTIPAPAQLSQGESHEESEDDDDWGEMVSSPRVESQKGPALATELISNKNGTPLLSTNSASNASNMAIINEKSIETAQSSSTAPGLSTLMLGAIPSPAQRSTQPASLTVETPKVDSWPAVDFSVFEGVSPQTPKSPRQDTWPFANLSIFESPASGSVPALIQPPNIKSNLHSGPRTNNTNMNEEVKTAKAPLKAVLGPIENKTRKQDEDNIVKNVVQNLPDLSYMLH